MILPSTFRLTRLAAVLAAVGGVALCGPAWAVDAEFRVSTNTSIENYDPKVASDAAGNFVVAWPTEDKATNTMRIFARVYGPSGRARTAAIPVSSAVPYANHVSVGMNAGGEFVVAWMQLSTTNGYDIIYRRYGANGQPKAAPSRVNSTAAGDQLFPSVGVFANGSSVIAWRSGYQQGSDIFMRRFDAQGTGGSDVRVNTAATGAQDFPAVAVRSDGQFVVTWADAPVDQPFRIVARLFAPSGTPATGNIPIDTLAGLYPVVAMDEAGNFVVAWQTTGTDVYARRYGPTGAPQAAKFRVNKVTTGSQDRPSVAMDAQGRFTVSWRADETGVRYRRFGADGVATSNDLVLRTRTGGLMSFPSVASDADDNVVGAWTVGNLEANANDVVWARRLPSREAVDLSLGIADARDPVYGGEVVAQTFTVSNLHPPASIGAPAQVQDAIGLAANISVTVEGNVSLADATVQGAGWNCGARLARWTCTYGLPLLPGQSAGFDVTLPGGYPVGTTVTLNGTATESQHPDFVASNNVDSESTAVTCKPSVVRFNSATATVAEGAPSLKLDVVRTGSLCGTSTVSYKTVKGTATPTLDFTPVTGTLTWDDSDASGRIITVPILNDRAGEPSETFGVVLLESAGAVVGKPGSVTVTVTDND